MKPVPELDLRPKPAPQFTPADMADCMSSGLSGMNLARALHHHFPRAGRAEVYLAAGMAIALLQADLTLAEMEIQALRAGGAE